MDTDNLKKIISILDVLAIGFLYPGDEIGQVQGVLNLVGGDLGIEGPGPAPIDAEELRAVYTSLFINAPGGVPAPPYASVYFGGAGILNQMGAEVALRYYAEAGVEPSVGDAPDHVSACLAFAGLLLERGEVARLAGYLDSYLMKWFPEFASRVMEADRGGFYAALAAVSVEVLKWLQMAIGEGCAAGCGAAAAGG